MSGYVLKKDDSYIHIGKNNKVERSKEKQTIFATVEEAKAVKLRAKTKTKNYEIVPVEPKKEEESKKSVKKETVAAAQQKPCTSVRRKQYSEDTKKLLFIQSKGRCGICGAPVRYEEMTIDHIIPLSKGGKDDVTNLQCVHLHCNQAKGQMLPSEFVGFCFRVFIHNMEAKYKGRKDWDQLKKRILQFLSKKK